MVYGYTLIFTFNINSLLRIILLFWNSSGLRIDAGLFSGVEVATESIESLLSDGISMATPESGNGQSAAAQDAVFVLEEKADDKWQSWKPRINLEK